MKMSMEKARRCITTANKSSPTPSIKPFLYFPFEYKVNSFCANWTESDVNDFFSPIPFLLSTAIFSIAGPLILNYLGFSIKSISYELGKKNISINSIAPGNLYFRPILEAGLTINMKGSSVSTSYIEMTLKLMNLFGIKSDWNKNIIIHNTFTSITWNQSND